MIAMLPVDPVDGAGLRDDAMEQGKLRSVPLNGLTAFARSIPAGRPGRETATAANFQRQSTRRYARPAGPRTLALDSPTPGQGSDGRAKSRPRSRPEMAPQVFGKARFAPGNGAPGLSIHMPAACRLQSAVDKPNASRPEMLPQGLEKIESAPGNGSRSDRSIRRPAVWRLPSAVGKPNASWLEMLLQQLERIDSAPGNAGLLDRRSNRGPYDR